MNPGPAVSNLGLPQVGQASTGPSPLPAPDLPDVPPDTVPRPAQLAGLPADAVVRWLYGRFSRIAERLRPIVQGSLDDDPRPAWEEAGNAVEELKAFLGL